MIQNIEHRSITVRSLYVYDDMVWYMLQKVDSTDIKWNRIPYLWFQHLKFLLIIIPASFVTYTTTYNLRKVNLTSWESHPSCKNWWETNNVIMFPWLIKHDDNASLQCFQNSVKLTFQPEHLYKSLYLFKLRIRHCYIYFKHSINSFSNATMLLKWQTDTKN